MEILSKEAFLNLDTKCEEVKEEDVKDLIPKCEEMIKLCVEKGGLGLAGPQVGLMKKVFVWMNSDDTFQIVLNPSFYPDSKKTNVIEGCLSFPNENYYLKRYKEIQAVYFTHNGEKLIKVTKHLIGQKAFVFQHETDHMNMVSVADSGIKIET